MVIFFLFMHVLIGKIQLLFTLIREVGKFRPQSLRFTRSVFQYNVTVEPTGKASFVYSYIQTRLINQYNWKWPISFLWVKTADNGTREHHSGDKNGDWLRNERFRDNIDGGRKKFGAIKWAKLQKTAPLISKSSNNKSWQYYQLKNSYLTAMMVSWTLHLLLLSDCNTSTNKRRGPWIMLFVIFSEIKNLQVLNCSLKSNWQVFHFLFNCGVLVIALQTIQCGSSF